MFIASIPSPSWVSVCGLSWLAEHSVLRRRLDPSLCRVIERMLRMMCCPCHQLTSRLKHKSRLCLVRPWSLERACALLSGRYSRRLCVQGPIGGNFLRSIITNIQTHRTLQGPNLCVLPTGPTAMPFVVPNVPLPGPTFPLLVGSTPYLPKVFWSTLT